MDSKFDVYKYRRQTDRLDIPLNSLERSHQSRQNIRYEIDEQKRQKTYAILQETGTEFTVSKLRAILLIYSDPAWKMFILTTLFVEYFIDTYLYTFCKAHEREKWLIGIIICMNFVFIIDVIIIIGLKLSRNWRKSLNLVEPDSFRVILDVILAIPYAFLYLVSRETASFDFVAIAPIVAAMRVYRILEYFYNRSSQAGSNQWTTFLFQYLVLFLLSVHTWTCVWYIFSYRNFDIHKIHLSWSSAAIYLPTENTFDWYFVCSYWSVMFLTTNALGDLYPVTTIERITAITATLVGFLLTTVVFVGSLTSQFITITTRRAKYVRQTQKIQKHMELIKMDPETTKRIIR